MVSGLIDIKPIVKARQILFSDIFSGGENIYFYYSSKNITPEELAQKAVTAFYEVFFFLFFPHRDFERFSNISNT